MAIIRGAYGGAEVRGSIANTVFSRNGSGAYIRNRSKPVNPQSPGQVAIRQALSVNSNSWVNTLSAAQRDAWNNYAVGTPIPNSLGELVNIGGRQQYLRTNNARLLAGLGVILDAPLTPGVAEAPTMLYTGDTVDGIEGAVTLPLLAAGDLVFVRIGIAVNQSVNFYAAPYTFAAGVVLATAQPFLIKPAVEVAVSQRYFIEARFFQNDGKVSFSERAFVDILV